MFILEIGQSEWKFIFDQKFKGKLHIFSLQQSSKLCSGKLKIKTMNEFDFIQDQHHNCLVFTGQKNS